MRRCEIRYNNSTRMDNFIFNQAFFETIFMSGRMCDTISHISALCQSTLCNFCAAQYTIIHYFKAEISFKMVPKIENHSFLGGNLWTVAISTDFMSVRMCEMISHISTLCQSTLCNILVGCNKPSSIILKQKCHLKCVIVRKSLPL